jgi:hypothetical protein
MSQEQSHSWIADGEKYALLGLSVKVIDPAIKGLDLSPNFRLISGNDFTIQDHWRDWLGSIRVGEVEARDLFIAVKLRSVALEVLDGENIQLNNRVWGFYRGLLLSSTFATAHKPVVLSGSCSNGELGLRQIQELDAPVPNDFRPYPDVTAENFKEAATLSERYGQMIATRQSSNRWRFNRVLHLYTETRAEREILGRIHQYTRCLDGFVTTGPGQGRKDFKNRTQLFIGPLYQDLIGEIYDVRSSVEHLHEDRYLDPFLRETQLDLVKKEAIIEHIARTTLARVTHNEPLWEHFTNKAALADFWAKPEAERQAIWGDSIDPMVALAEFDERFLPPAQLS